MDEQAIDLSAGFVPKQLPRVRLRHMALKKLGFTRENESMRQFFRWLV
jgi:hypothetical protein